MRVVSTSEFAAAVRDSGASFQLSADTDNGLDHLAELLAPRRPRKRRRPRGTRRAGLADAFAAYTRRR